MDIYFRRIGWNMKTSGHYTFCTIYGRVCHSFIKHGIQTIQYMINLIKSLFLKVSDKVFIIYPSTVLYNEHSVGRCFQNHIDCGINFTVIKLSFFGKLCMNFMLFCEGLNYKGSSMAIRTSCMCQYSVDQSGTTTAALVLFQVIFSSVWHVMLKGGKCKRNCCSMSARLHLLLLLLLRNIINHTYLIVYWCKNK